VCRRADKVNPVLALHRTIVFYQLTNTFYEIRRLRRVINVQFRRQKVLRDLEVEVEVQSTMAFGSVEWEASASRQDDLRDRLGFLKAENMTRAMAMLAESEALQPALRPAGQAASRRSRSQRTR
jgi:hypothetical protein